MLQCFWGSSFISSGTTLTGDGPRPKEYLPDKLWGSERSKPETIVREGMLEGRDARRMHVQE